MNRWYHFKKSFALYPGVGAPVCAPFLAEHYRDRRAERSRARAVFDGVGALLFRSWIPWRARAVAKRYRLGAGWARRASAIGRQRYADPNDLALFRIARPEELDGFMRRFEYAGVSKRINPACWRPECVLANKALFAARCADHGLPHPALLATISAGRAAVAVVPAAGALIVKPAGGEGGSGIRQTEWPGGGAAAFAVFLERQPRLGRSMLVVQPRLRPHSVLAPVALAALPTARLTTIRDEQGEPELVTSVLRFPSVATALVDNIKAGGLMAPIDPATGALGAACRGKQAGEVAHHPVTGAAIAGLQLPHWEAAKQLVVRAHRDAFPEYAMVGWDVAFTKIGPVLIEGNGKPCIVVAQRATGRGIGETRFGTLIAHHLAHAPSAR